MIYKRKIQRTFLPHFFNIFFFCTPCVYFLSSEWVKEEEKDKDYKKWSFCYPCWVLCRMCLIHWDLPQTIYAVLTKVLWVFCMYFEFLCFFKILSNKPQIKYPLELVFLNRRFFTTQWHTWYSGTHPYRCVCEPISSLPAIRIFPSPSLDSHLI